MFGWLFGKKKTPSIGYTPQERVIYHYFDGKNTIRADPTVLMKRVISKWDYISTQVKVAKSPSQGAEQAQRDVNNAIREIFDVKPLEKNADGTGLTDPEVNNLLSDFLEYCEALKKNMRTSSTSSTYSEGFTFSSPNVSPSSSSSASGSVETASVIEESTSSPMASSSVMAPLTPDSVTTDP